MKITIEHYETILSAQIPEESDLEQTINAIRVLLVGVGFQEKAIREYLNTENTENEDNT